MGWTQTVQEVIDSDPYGDDDKEQTMNRGLIGTIIGVLVIIVLVIVILQLT